MNEENIQDASHGGLGFTHKYALKLLHNVIKTELIEYKRNKLSTRIILKEFFSINTIEIVHGFLITIVCSILLICFANDAIYRYNSIVICDEF